MTGGRRRSTVRSILAGIAGVLAVVGILVGTLGLWAKSNVLSSERVIVTAYEVLGEPEVADAIATFVVDQLESTLDLESRLTGVLPSALDRLVPVVLPGIESRATDRLSELIQRDDVRRVIARAVGRAHAELVELLEGDGLVDGITVQDGAVTINLLPLFARALTQLQNFGLFDDLSVPDIDRSGDPGEQIAQLESALGRDLPDDFGQVVVYRSDNLKSASQTLASTQRMLVAVSRAVWVFLIGGLVLAVVSAWLAAKRPRAAIVLAASLLVLYFAVRLGTRYVVDEAPTLVTRPGAKVTITEVLARVQSSLLGTTISYIAIAIAVIALAVLVRRDADAPTPEE